MSVISNKQKLNRPMSITHLLPPTRVTSGKHSRTQRHTDCVSERNKGKTTKVTHYIATKMQIKLKFDVNN